MHSIKIHIIAQTKANMQLVFIFTNQKRKERLFFKIVIILQNGLSPYHHFKMVAFFRRWYIVYDLVGSVPLQQNNIISKNYSKARKLCTNLFFLSLH